MCKVKEASKQTCREYEEDKERNAYPFRGNIVVLDLQLSTTGTVRGAFEAFKCYWENSWKPERKDTYSW
jgi:hypothetical protein